MIESGLVNILCDNEVIIAQVVDKNQNLYKSLNITMGAVNVLDVIEAKPNDKGVLELIGVIEEGIPHKELFFFKDAQDWSEICIKAGSMSDKCIIQGLAMPHGPQPGVVAIAYIEGFDVRITFGSLIQAMPEE